MDDPRIMRRLIARNAAALSRFGGQRVATVATLSKSGQVQKDHLLNEGQAIYIASRSETALAVEVHVALVQVFVAWRQGRLGPFASGSDRARLEAGRAYFRSVPETTRAIADGYVEAIRMVEAMIAGGLGAWDAVRAVCALKGIPERTLHSYRSKVRMVPEADWGAATVRQYHRPRGMLAPCHPEALQFFRNLNAGGLRVSDCYRRMAEEAAARGWTPIPTQRTMYRVAKRPAPQVLPRPATFGIGAA
jgi:hypothetical protein